MKRKLSDAASPSSTRQAQSASAGVPDASTLRRRQPQVSCDFCRHKKLKCDRARPCSNCTARGRECKGGPVVTAAPRHLDATDILERLCRLEQAVFHAKDGHFPRQGETEGAGIQVVRPEPPPRRLPTPSPSDLDYPSAGDPTVPDTDDGFRFRTAESLNSSGPKRHYRLEKGLPPCVLLPTEEDAVAMFDYFLHMSHCLPLTLHVPSARSAISNFYSDACCAESAESDMVEPALAAFILSICATAAFFWNEESTVSCSLFSSVKDAARQAHIWLNTTWELLDHSSRVSNPGSLEEVQAYLILSDLVYNMEGCSTRYRYLHSRALTASRAISLHLIDGPGQGTDDTDPSTEVKRRVWWHIVSSDWLLSTMGGPLERTYQVQPRHMLVNFPRNVDDDDSSAEFPSDTVTGTTYFIQRIRLAEVCRSAVDRLPLGGCDIDSLPYEAVLAISQLFTDAMASMPPGFALDAPVPPGSPPSTVMNRRIIHLAFHARLARVFRPFLLVPDQPRPGREIDPRCSQFRSLCLRSARSVLKTASDLLREFLEGAARAGPLPLMHRSGCVVSHIFMACVVLATDPELAPAGKDSHLCDDSSDAETIRRELSDARRLLERVGERSPMAASLVGKLAGVLKRHALQAVAEHHPAPPASAAVATSSPSDGAPIPAVLSASSGATPETDMVAAESQTGWTEQQPANLAGSLHVSDGAVKDLSWDLGDGGGDFNPQMLDGIEWAALMGAGLADANSWSDLFADLDAACPGSM